MAEDRQLIEQIRQGDQKAFRLLFEKYYSGLLGYGSHLLGDRESARELIQDLYLTLWENRQSIRIESVKSYLYTSLYHKALNLIRHRRVAERMSKEIGADQVQTTDASYPAPFLQQALIRAIESLPPRARDCFTLTQLDELSIRETAGRLGLSEKTVENHLARSRKILRKKLKKYRH